MCLLILCESRCNTVMYMELIDSQLRREHFHLCDPGLGFGVREGEGEICKPATAGSGSPFLFLACLAWEGGVWVKGERPGDHSP